MASKFSLWLGLLTAWQPIVRESILRGSFWTMNILREPVGSCKAFYQPTSEVIKYHFCYRDDRGWDGWMASPTRWTWVWVNSGSWWWTVRPGMLRFMGSQRVGHDWATDLIWLVEVIISLPRSKKKAHRPLPFKREMTNNLGSFFKSPLGHCLPSSPYLNMSRMLSLMSRHCNSLLIKLWRECKIITEIKAPTKPSNCLG